MFHVILWLAMGLALGGANDWQIAFHLSGGFAGFDRILELASTGDLTAVDNRRGIRVVKRATADDLTMISDAVAGLGDPETGRGSNCRDCLEYRIEIRMSGRSRVWRIDGSNLPGSKIEVLARALSNVLNRALSDNETRFKDIPGERHALRSSLRCTS